SSIAPPGRAHPRGHEHGGECLIRGVTRTAERLSRVPAHRDAADPDGAPASEALFARARAVIPGGVSSPVRAFRAVGGTPRFLVSGHGPYVVDADGREYVDLVGSWGPMILGHAHPEVVAAIQAQASSGTSFGAP